MTYHLSSNAILSTVHALAALQALSCSDDERAVLAPVLCRQRSGVRALMIRNAFAEVMLKLGPLVRDTSLDGEAGDTAVGFTEADAAPDADMWAELLTPESFTTTRHGIVRRAIEQCVAFTALSTWCAASASEGAVTVSENFASLASGWHRTVMSALSPDIYPAIRHEG